MKKLIILFLFLCSCEKEPEYCYDCWKDFFFSGANMSFNIDFCDITESEMQEIINENTVKFSEVSYTKMRCFRQK
jgi:hypothetical protein